MCFADALGKNNIRHDSRRGGQSHEGALRARTQHPQWETGSPETPERVAECDVARLASWTRGQSWRGTQGRNTWSPEGQGAGAPGWTRWP